jgi:heme/copper-type cytochrome/quinol oxidase subunit 2
MVTRFADAIFWVAVACSVVAQLAIVRSSIVSPVQASASGTSSTGRRRALEICWAIIPGVVLALLFVATWHTMHPAMATHAMSAR